MCSTITRQELTQGGVRNGIAYDPASYVAAGRQQRFAQLDDETCAAVATRLQACARHHHASINATLA
eukprot:15459486-Alexandrium_andersonii.AAC.1